MRKIIAALLSCIILILSFTACNTTHKPDSKAEGGYTFTDALGNSVTVDNPQRVVALMGSFAEIWTLAGGKLVGVTTDAISEKKMEFSDDVSTVGAYNAPNSEEILALNPDFVILSSETKEHLALADVLENSGITAAYFNVTYFDDYLHMLKICTEITGKPENYETNGTKVKELVDTHIANAGEKESPKVLFMITYSKGVIVKNSECQTGDMLKDLNCINIADQTQSLLKEFSIEKIIEENPDYIFVVPMGNDYELATKNLKQSVESNPAWKDLDAVKNDRYKLLPKELFLYKPNAEWADAYEYLYEILYK